MTTPQHSPTGPRGSRKIELCRGDGAASPCLAAAAALAAGLDGIERGLGPGEPGATGKGPELPPTPLQADAVFSGALHAVGTGVSRYFADLKRAELFDCHATVGPWEFDRYPTTF
ncbi:glutamine synthetase [Streptomyces sp. MBT62]|uniref:glutamine synthetase n=1 Tax=Streptomyces sp. MBT62 TaxID=2800410 RepID=UPI001F3EBEE2|nr:glutamine synthetase [Streptomyces sp. MBT62]